MSASEKPAIDLAAIPNGVLVRKPVVLAYTSLGVTTLWHRLKAGTFPQPRQFNGRSPLWLIDDVRAFCRGEWESAA